MTGNEPGTRSGRRDFFISYATQDGDWARWIAKVLQDAGYTVLLQDQDFRPGTDWVHQMHRATIECDCTLAVLSHTYLRSLHGEAEWRAAYRADPSGEFGSLIPVRIDDVSPPGLLATRVYLDLAGLDEAEAERRLLAGVRQPRAAQAPDPPPTQPRGGYPGRRAASAAAADDSAGQRLPVVQEDPVLAGYLRAVATRYDYLPYLSLRADAQLSSVYVDPYVEDISVAIPSASSTPLAAATRRTGDTIIDTDVNVLIEGGPGAGKSSLVCHVATRLAAGGRYLPAVVRANTLHSMAGSFSERLRKSVTAELGGRLISPLPDDFFAAERSNQRWLVLVDGLDEIISSRDRAQLVADLLHLTGAVDSPYRILIATRPVPSESQHDWSGFSRLRLLPLTDEQISLFAQSWFQATAGLAGLELARRFTDEMRHYGLTELLRTPLVLTMAASVFSPGEGGILPRNRAGIYERFLDLIDDEESERRTRAAFRQAWDQRYGHRAEVMADDVFSLRRQTLEYLATTRQQTRDGPLLGAATEFMARHWTVSADLVPDPEWLAQQAAVLLVRSALVVPAGPDYEFIHETVREYLVADATVRSGLTPGEPAAHDLVRRWREAAWRQVILFLLGIWSNRGQDIDDLLGLIRGDGPAGVIFAASVIADGIRVAPAVRDATIGELGSLVRSMSWGQVLFSDPNPFRIMVSIGGPLCAAELLATAVDETAEPPVRAFSAESLSELDLDPAALDVLTALSRESGEVMVRHGAATALARLGRLELAVPILEAVASDSSVGLLLRSHAVDTLGEHEAVSSLQRLADLVSLDPSLREIAAAHLETGGHAARAAMTLTALIKDDRVDVRVRERAILDLSQGGETAALRDIAGSSSAEGWIRVLAATHLARAGDRPEAILILRALARDEDQDERVRLRAVSAMSAQQDHEGLLALVASSGGLVRLAAASSAPRKDHLDELLAAASSVAADNSLPPDVRQEAADVLQRFGATAEAASFLLKIARTADVPSHVREQAVLSLCSGRHAAELHAICQDPALPDWLRISGCDALARVGTPSNVVQQPFFAELRKSADGWLRQRLDALIEKAQP